MISSGDKKEPGLLWLEAGTNGGRRRTIIRMIEY
jgi:hypothetical protein